MSSSQTASAAATPRRLRLADLLGDGATGIGVPRRQRKRRRRLLPHRPAAGRRRPRHELRRVRRARLHAASPCLTSEGHPLRPCESSEIVQAAATSPPTLGASGERDLLRARQYLPQRSPPHAAAVAQNRSRSRSAQQLAKRAEGLSKQQGQEEAPRLRKAGAQALRAQGQGKKRQGEQEGDEVQGARDDGRVLLAACDGRCGARAWCDAGAPRRFAGRHVEP